MDLKRLSRKVLYAGKVFDLIVDEVEYPSGNTSIREIAHHRGGSVVVPLLDTGEVLLVRQHRYPLDAQIYELPAGKLGPGEDPAHAAARELEEETGYSAGSLEYLTSIYTTPGFCDETLHLYLARHLQPSQGGHRREEGEFSMTVLHVALADALRLVESGEIKDGKTIVGLLWVERLMKGRTR